MDCMETKGSDSPATHLGCFSSLHALLNLRARLDFRHTQLECLLKVLP